VIKVSLDRQELLVHQEPKELLEHKDPKEHLTIPQGFQESLELQE
jgi:hypothetical protein